MAYSAISEEDFQLEESSNIFDTFELVDRFNEMMRLEKSSIQKPKVLTFEFENEQTIQSSSKEKKKKNAKRSQIRSIENCKGIRKLWLQTLI
ncbi:hypothetical protein BLOT_015932 [Blomia tropicalis]|nr:hypothetical protein BLOT_015932 [Blomia tropicalis]